MLTEKFNVVDVRLDDLQNSVSSMKMSACMNFLVTYLQAVSNGQKMDDVTTQRFYELYDYYTSHGGNSYIREKVRKLKEGGKL